jgi:hypothetical protein
MPEYAKRIGANSKEATNNEVQKNGNPASRMLLASCQDASEDAPSPSPSPSHITKEEKILVSDSWFGASCEKSQADTAKPEAEKVDATTKTRLDKKQKRGTGSGTPPTRAYAS